MQLDTGIIKEVDNDDDFCLPTGRIQQVINIAPKWQNQHQVQEDRMAFGVAHGITGTGELQLVQVGHKLKQIMKDDAIYMNARLFSSQKYSGQGCRDIKKTYSTKIFQLNESKISVLDPQDFGIDPNKKIIAFHETQGAISIVSENNIVIFCTLKYKGMIKSIDEESIINQNLMKQEKIKSHYVDAKDNQSISFQSYLQYSQSSSQLSSQSSSSQFSSSSSFVSSSSQHSSSSSSSLLQSSSTNGSESSNQKTNGHLSEESKDKSSSTTNEQSYQSHIKTNGVSSNQQQNPQLCTTSTLGQSITQSEQHSDIDLSIQQTSDNHNPSSSTFELHQSLLQGSTHEQSNFTPLTQITENNNNSATNTNRSSFPQQIIQSEQAGLQQQVTKLPLAPLKQPKQVFTIRAIPIKNKLAIGRIWKMPPWFTKEESQKIQKYNLNIEDWMKQTSQIPSRQVTIDHAAVGDNIIVVSHKNIVYVLLWDPAVPAIQFQKKHSQLLNLSTRLALLIQQSQQKNDTSKEEQNDNNNNNNNNNNTLDQQKLKEQQDFKLSMHLQAVCTLNLDSDVTSLGAVSICGNQFFIVCTKDPDRARIFRLNSSDDDVEFQKENKKIW
ncbi:MAG: hypothetical protein EZS28_036101, partial [Streblomastix strix]